MAHWDVLERNALTARALAERNVMSSAESILRALHARQGMMGEKKHAYTHDSAGAEDDRLVPSIMAFRNGSEIG